MVSDAHEGLKAAMAQGLERRQLAALPGAFYGQFVLPCAAGQSSDGGGGAAHHLCPTQPGCGPPSVAGGLRGPVAPLAPSRPGIERCGGGRLGFHGFSAGALETHLLQQPPGTAQQRGQAPRQRGGVFPNEPVVLAEQAYEWHIAKRYFSLESVRKLDQPQPLVMAETIPFTLAPVD